MNDKDWQARALEVARGWTLPISAVQLQEAILAFAKEYAAEARGENEMLKAALTRSARGVEELRASRASTAEARAEVERLKAENFALAAGICPMGFGDDGGTPRCCAEKEIADLRAQLDASGSVKVPKKMNWQDVPESIGGTNHRDAYARGWNDAIAEVLRLNAPPKEKD